MSKDVHFTPHDTSSSFDEEQIFRGVDRVGLLILALIIRCQLLLGCVPEGINKRYREMHDSNAAPAELAQSLKTKPAEVGDIVWIQGDYAEVLNVTMSKYGYPAYNIKYIEHAPLSEVPEDWFAGFEVKLVARKEKVEKAATLLARRFKNPQGSPKIEQYFWITRNAPWLKYQSYSDNFASSLLRHLRRVRRIQRQNQTSHQKLVERMNTKDFLRLGVPLGEATRRATICCPIHPRRGRQIAAVQGCWSRSESRYVSIQAKPSVPRASIIWLARAVNVVRPVTFRLHIDGALRQG